MHFHKWGETRRQGKTRQEREGDRGQSYGQGAVDRRTSNLPGTLQICHSFQEKRAPEIVLKAMGQAISKTVATAEIIKRRVYGLHQNTELSSTSITDVWEPIEEGLLPLETTRHVSMITITLSTKPLDQTSVGYQAPLPSEQLKQQMGVNFDGDSRGGRTGGRGTGRGRFRGRGWGRSGWGFARGRGRGWGTARGRGRGRGYVANEIEA
eukprot:Gb_08119 [translate_table: standard]